MPGTEPISSPDNSITASQCEVQRQLGRCLLRIQQYERLMKAMLAGAAQEGTSTTIESTLASKATEVGDKTLGTLLVNYFLKEFLVDSSKNDNQTRQTEAAAETSAERQVIATGLPYFKFRFQIRMEPEAFEKTKRLLLQLRDLRNEVVHHLLDQFDVCKESECLDAIAYLDTCYVFVDERYQQLKGWAASMKNASALAASFSSTQQFKDLVCNGIYPDGTVDWPASGAVQALREAEIACAKEGWTLLDSAIVWLRADHSDQTPAKYQCKTWKQVLKRSKQFEIRATVDPASTRGKTWFRSRTTA